MQYATEAEEQVAEFEILPQPPAELTQTRLRRLGEGVGKVVYASEHWVVKRERSKSEILALITIWKVLQRMERLLPARLHKRLAGHPSRQIRLLRVTLQPLMLVLPKGLWFMRHIAEVWHVYTSRDERGQRLAEEHLSGTALVPETISFPPTRVKVGGWPGWLTVDEATERVEATLHQRMIELAEQDRFDEIEHWLDRLLEARRAGWQRGVFSVDAHLKNFGVTGNRVVLLDPGGLTDEWRDVEVRLAYEDGTPPHVRLGLSDILAEHPDMAERFDWLWRVGVNIEQVRQHWPGDPE